MSGKRVSGSSHKKSIALVVSLALVLTAVLGVTIAYLTAQTPGVTNTFIPGQVSCRVDEEVSGNTKTSVTVANTGDTDVYIRVAVVANKVDEQGNLLAGNPGIKLGQNDLGRNWVKHTDGYYYYTETVSPGGSTGNLLNEGSESQKASTIELNDGTQVTILAEAIQTTGEVDGKTTTQYAWGVTIKNGSVDSYTEPAAKGGISG